VSVNNTILTKKTWALALHAAQKASWRSYQEGKPWYRFASATSKPFSVRDVSEVLAFHEDKTITNDARFRSVMRLKDGRYIYFLAYLSPDSEWDTEFGGVWAGWDLRNLVLRGLDADDIEALKMEHILR